MLKRDNYLVGKYLLMNKIHTERFILKKGKVFI